MIDSISFAVLFPLLIAALYYYQYFYSHEATARRVIRKTPAKPLHTIQTGEFVKVVGQVRYNQFIYTSPLSNQDCAFYHIWAEEKRGSGKSTHWYKIIEEEVGAPLLICKDETYILVPIEWVKLHITFDTLFSSNLWNDAPDVFENYLAQRGHSTKLGWGLNLTKRILEGTLKENDWIAVVGYGTWKNAKELGLDLPNENVLVLEGNKTRWGYLSNDQKVLRTSH